MKARSVHDIFFFSRINDVPFKDIANDAYVSTKTALKDKIDLIDTYLAPLNTSTSNVNQYNQNDQITILVGTEDFFDSVTSTDAYCYDLRAVYDKSRI